MLPPSFSWLPTESRLIVLMRDLERLSEKRKAVVAGIAMQRAARPSLRSEFDIEHDLKPDLCYRLEQWDSDSLARTIFACSSLHIAICRVA
jgi:hypothetical protein